MISASYYDRALFSWAKVRNQLQSLHCKILGLFQMYLTDEHLLKFVHSIRMQVYVMSIGAQQLLWQQRWHALYIINMVYCANNIHQMVGLVIYQSRQAHLDRSCHAYCQVDAGVAAMLVLFVTWWMQLTRQYRSGGFHGFPLKPPSLHNPCNTNMHILCILKTPCFVPSFFTNCMWPSCSW